MRPLLKVTDLRTYFFSRIAGRFIRAVDGVCFEISPAETFGIVGESGRGKTVTALSVMGLVRDEPGILEGSVIYSRGLDEKSDEREEFDLLSGLPDFVDLEKEGHRVTEVIKDNRAWLEWHDRRMKDLRGRDLSMIFQNPKASLNPYYTIGDQIVESLMRGRLVDNKEKAWDEATNWLKKVYVDLPEQRMKEYSFNFSGGMCQRAMIAMALACAPRLLIADEPTTGLDATIQSVIVDLLVELKEKLHVAILLITHNIDVVSRLCDRVGVMYAGRMIEYGPANKVLAGSS